MSIGHVCFLGSNGIVYSIRLYRKAQCDCFADLQDGGMQELRQIALSSVLGACHIEVAGAY